MHHRLHFFCQLYFPRKHIQSPYICNLNIDIFLMFSLYVTSIAHLLLSVPRKGISEGFTTMTTVKPSEVETVILGSK